MLYTSQINDRTYCYFGVIVCCFIVPKSIASEDYDFVAHPLRPNQSHFSYYLLMCPPQPSIVSDMLHEEWPFDGPLGTILTIHLASPSSMVLCEGNLPKCFRVIWRVQFWFGESAFLRINHINLDIVWTSK